MTYLQELKICFQLNKMAITIYLDNPSKQNYSLIYDTCACFFVSKLKSFKGPLHLYDKKNMLYLRFQNNVTYKSIEYTLCNPNIWSLNFYKLE